MFIFEILMDELSNAQKGKFVDTVAKQKRMYQTPYTSIKCNSTHLTNKPHNMMYHPIAQKV